MTPGFQQRFWDGPGSSKTFTHPINPTWLAQIPLDATLLDYGCGYGRIAAELAEHGYRHVIGVDPSASLISRGRAEHPDQHLILMTDPPSVPEQIGPADLIMVFAVLTCVPADHDQKALMDAVWRAAAPGGLVYLSDVVIEPGEERYRDRAEPHFPYGTFRTSDGGLVRHHSVEHLRALLGHELLGEEHMAVRTMNGGSARAVQLLARKAN